MRALAQTQQTLKDLPPDQKARLAREADDAILGRSPLAYASY